jgi:hypothetical protein
MSLSVPVSSDKFTLGTIIFGDGTYGESTSVDGTSVVNTSVVNTSVDGTSVDGTSVVNPSNTSVVSTSGESASGGSTLKAYVRRNLNEIFPDVSVNAAGDAADVSDDIFQTAFDRLINLEGMIDKIKKNTQEQMSEGEVAVAVNTLFMWKKQYNPDTQLFINVLEEIIKTGVDRETVLENAANVLMNHDNEQKTYSDIMPYLTGRIERQIRKFTKLAREAASEARGYAKDAREIALEFGLLNRRGRAAVGHKAEHSAHSETDVVAHEALSETDDNAAQGADGALSETDDDVAQEDVGALAPASAVAHEADRVAHEADRAPSTTAKAPTLEDLRSAVSQLEALAILAKKCARKARVNADKVNDIRQKETSPEEDPGSLDYSSQEE